MIMKILRPLLVILVFSCRTTQKETAISPSPRATFQEKAISSQVIENKKQENYEIGLRYIKENNPLMATYFFSLIEKNHSDFQKAIVALCFLAINFGDLGSALFYLPQISHSSVKVFLQSFLDYKMMNFEQSVMALERDSLKGNIFSLLKILNYLAIGKKDQANQEAMLLSSNIWTKKPYYKLYEALKK